MHLILPTHHRFLSSTGNNIQFTPALRIPIEHQMPITRQQESLEITQQRFKNITQESCNEASYYLGECDGDLERALVAWKEDKDWNDTHYYPNFNEQNSDIPLDESVHIAKRNSRRGWLQSHDKSQKVIEEGATTVTTATTTATRTTESWTLVEYINKTAVITASTGVEIFCTPQYESYNDDNSDIYVVPANTSWKYPKIESANRVMISERFLSIFGGKRNITTDTFGIPVEGNMDSVLRPLIDPNPSSRRQIS